MAFCLCYSKQCRVTFEKFKVSLCLYEQYPNDQNTWLRTELLGVWPLLCVEGVPVGWCWHHRDQHIQQHFHRPGRLWIGACGMIFVWPLIHSHGNRAKGQVHRGNRVHLLITNEDSTFSQLWTGTFIYLHLREHSLWLFILGLYYSSAFIELCSVL